MEDNAVGRASTLGNGASRSHAKRSRIEPKSVMPIGFSASRRRGGLDRDKALRQVSDARQTVARRGRRAGKGALAAALLVPGMEVSN